MLADKCGHGNINYTYHVTRFRSTDCSLGVTDSQIIAMMSKLPSVKLDFD
jgi:hypothetical protein